MPQTLSLLDRAGAFHARRPAGRDESRMGNSRTDRYRITDFVSFVPIVFEPDVKNENGTKTEYTKR
jgi:hypothetical protein